MEDPTFAEPEEAGLHDDITPNKSMVEADSGCKSSSSKSKRPSCSKQQAIAKRNRSAKLSDEFAALAAIVPGTEEARDETTVLEASIKYMKQLQARVETLEEQNHSESGTCTSDENFTNDLQPLPQIEARVSDKNVLLHIHCELCKGVVVKVLEETENLHLIVVSSSATQFGSSTLDITIAAEMNDEFIMTVKDLVKNLRSSLIQFTGMNLQHRHEN